MLNFSRLNQRKLLVMRSGDVFLSSDVMGAGGGGAGPRSTATCIGRAFHLICAHVCLVIKTHQHRSDGQMVHLKDTLGMNRRGIPFSSKPFFFFYNLFLIKEALIIKILYTFFFYFKLLISEANPSTPAWMIFYFIFKPAREKPGLFGSWRMDVTTEGPERRFHRKGSWHWARAAVCFIQTFMYSFLKLYFQPISTFTIFICRYLYKVLS